MNQVRTASASTVAASVLIGVQGLLSAVLAIALVAARPHARLPLVEHAFRGARVELAIAAALVAMFLVIVAFAVANLEDWARIAALVAESLLLFVALVRFPVHPAASFLGAAIAALVFGLLIADDAWNAPAAKPGPGETQNAAPAR